MSWPLAVLEVRDETPFNAGFRFRGPGRWFGARDFAYTPDDLNSVHQVRGFMSSGVAFSQVDGKEVYFWTRRHVDLLALLRTRHYPVKDGVRREKIL